MKTKRRQIQFNRRVIASLLLDLIRGEKKKKNIRLRNNFLRYRVALAMRSRACNETHPCASLIQLKQGGTVMRDVNARQTTCHNRV